MGKPVLAARLPAEPLLQRMGVGVDGLHIPQREGERKGRRAVRQGRERVFPDEGRQQLEDAIRRSAVSCYAAEGIYPPDLTYLEEHYGIQVDETRYTVEYTVFASNLMPDITVLENEP